MEDVENFINHSLCSAQDFFITEDGKFDITATLLIPYSHYELDELQTEDFITAALPDLMNRLSEPNFFDFDR